MTAHQHLQRASRRGASLALALREAARGAGLRELSAAAELGGCACAAAAAAAAAARVGMVPEPSVNVSGSARPLQSLAAGTAAVAVDGSATAAELSLHAPEQVPPEGAAAPVSCGCLPVVRLWRRRQAPAMVQQPATRP
ncbi:MAG: hypothetical protein ACK4ZJ_19925, partial [Allorhizobium sp.]